MTRARGLPRSWAVAALVPQAIALGALLWLDARLRAAGRGDLAAISGGYDLVFLVVFATAAGVGTILVHRRPRHPVGWLFQGLALSVALAGATESYVAYGALARPGSLPAAGVAAAFADADFVPWLVLIALILHLTPTGRPLSSRWGRLAWTVVISGALWFAVGLVSRTPGPPFGRVDDPLLLEGAIGPLTVVRTVVGLVTGVGVVLAATSLIVRFRRSVGVERRQLLWLAVAAVPMPVLMAASFAASHAGYKTAAGLTAAAIMMLLAVGTGLAIGQYHLYDVDRILSRAVTYLLVSGVLAGSYAAAVVIVGQSLAGRAGRSQISAVVATLAAVTVAAPAYRGIQDRVDRRFNRRRFDVLRVVRAHVRHPQPGVTMEDVLRRALGDPGLRVAYWVDDRGHWVHGDGQPAEPGDGELEIRRHGRPVARIGFDTDRVERDLVLAAATQATAELDNARLRAAVGLQLVEVRQSRARIAAAQFTERRAIERNLHDGAQQRLLALALQLRAAELGGDVDRLRTVVGTGVDQLQLAVNELRELANGLHPAVLADGGLAAALDDLAVRTPVPIKISAPERRFPPALEATAWFIACEATANAVKHARPAAIHIEVVVEQKLLVVEVRDDGAGGAQPSGPGLRGITDRAEAAGGTLSVHSPAGTGTTVRAELPCVS